MNMADQAPNSIPEQPKPVAESQEAKEQSLKYLQFVQVLTLQALIQAAKLYSFAKENSGPLKPSVDSVEGTVKTVVGPVYDKYRDASIEFLRFVDRKVDESVGRVQDRVPPTVKQVSAQVLETAQKAPDAARSAVKNSGVVVDRASGIARQAYTKYEPVAEEYAASAWRSLNQIPYFPTVARAVAPTASYCSEKYNGMVTNAAEKGYRVAKHLPLVPTERFAKALET